MPPYTTFYTTFGSKKIQCSASCHSTSLKMIHACAVPVALLGFTAMQQCLQVSIKICMGCFVFVNTIRVFSAYYTYNICSWIWLKWNPLHVGKPHTVLKYISLKVDPSCKRQAERVPCEYFLYGIKFYILGRLQKWWCITFVSHTAEHLQMSFEQGWTEESCSCVGDGWNSTDLMGKC